MDASIPVARAVAIAGEHVAGGVGTHETALASPDRVDLGGRCVLPGFSDAHVHFPYVVARAAGGAPRGLGFARRDRLRAWRRRRIRRAGPLASWTRLAERRLVACRRAHAAGARRCHRRHAGRARWRATTTRSGSTRLRSPRRTAISQVAGGVVERDGDGEPTGVLREESAWRFRDRYLLESRRRVRRRDARGLRSPRPVE